jgi:heme/copper-type cytochrome/quinol oxidase subunit 4
MTKKLDSSDVGVSVGDRNRKRAYLREFIPAVALYVIAVVVTVTVGVDSNVKKAVFVVATFVPILMGVVAIARHLKRLDEFERTVTYRAMAVAFGAAMIVSVFIALLASSGLQIDGKVAAWAPFMVGMSTWAVLSVRHLSS